MNFSSSCWLQVLAIAVCAILVFCGCGEPSPSSGCESPAVPLEELIGQVFERGDSSQPIPSEDSVHPYSQEEMYIEILSDSEVRVHYERDGEVVVERFSVTQDS